MDEAGRAYVKTAIPDTRPNEALKANVYLKQGRLAVAQDWARARGLSADDEISYLGEFEHLTLARVLLHRSAPPEALGSVFAVLETAGGVGLIVGSAGVQLLVDTAGEDLFIYSNQ